MTAGRDDDAFTWDGDDDPTLDAGVGAAKANAEPLPAEPLPAEPLPEGWTAVGKGAIDGAVAAVVAEAEHPESVAHDADAAPASMGNVELVSLGVFGGVFLLYAVGWYLGATRLAAYQAQSGYGTVLGMPVFADDLLHLFWVVLVTVAPLIWFIVTMFLTRDSRFWKRFVALLVGVLLFVPWPFLTLGAIAS